MGMLARRSSLMCSAEAVLGGVQGGLCKDGDKFKYRARNQEEAQKVNVCAQTHCCECGGSFAVQFGQFAELSECPASTLSLQCLRHCLCPFSTHQQGATRLLPPINWTPLASGQHCGTVCLAKNDSHDPCKQYTHKSLPCCCRW